MLCKVALKALRSKNKIVQAVRSSIQDRTTAFGCRKSLQRRNQCSHKKELRKGTSRKRKNKRRKRDIIRHLNLVVIKVLVVSLKVKTRGLKSAVNKNLRKKYKNISGAKISLHRVQNLRVLKKCKNK
jgi:hypothetical protein